MTISTHGPRLGGLDGLRAIAVALVLVYHLFPPALTGGYLGVDIFFTISGFLIATLLIREWHRSGRINLRGFWQRRIRRLVPALVLVIFVTVSAGFVVGGDVLYRIVPQSLGALFFVSNWVFIWSGSDYFASDTPEVLRNTWSLAIEEQFYLFLPLALVVLLWMKSRRYAVFVFVLGGVGSAWRMWHLSLISVDPTRIYFGSDSHVFGMLLGVALALFMYPRHATALTPLPRQQRVFTSVSVVVGLVVLTWLSVTLPEASPQSFQGGFQLATVAALVTIAGATYPGAPIARLLDNAPLRYIGERSYGIYLWHWPILLLTREWLSPHRGWSAPTWVVGVVTLVVTLIAAHASHRYVETPMRRHGIRASVHAFWNALSQVPTIPGFRRPHAVVTGVTVLCALPLFVAAVLSAPQVTSSEAAVERGRSELVEAAEAPPHEQESVHEREEPAESDRASEPQTLTHGADITAVGDSVMLASAPELQNQFRDVLIDAEVSRGLAYGVGFVSDAAAAGQLRPIVVVGLGTNGPIDPDDLAHIATLTGHSRVVLVTAHADRWWISEVNEHLKQFAEAHRGVVLADWETRISAMPELLAADLIHPHAEGGQVYSEVIAEAIAELETPDEVVGYHVPRW